MNADPRPAVATSDGRSPDDGVATVLVVAGLAALLMVVVAATWLAAAVIARHRAAGAADLAALAGAAVVVRGADAACAAAIRIADANGATVQDCRVSGADVRIVAGVDLRVGPIAGTATARARAGPVTAITAMSSTGDGEP